MSRERFFENPNHRVNVILRVLAGLFVVLFTLILGDTIYGVYRDGFASLQWDLLQAIYIGLSILIWPFSVVAITGKAPKHWLPFKTS